MIIPLLVLLLVFALIAFRQFGGIRVQIWQAMLFGALAVLASGSITAADALRSINIDVMLFLFGTFVVGQSLEESGYLHHLSYKLFRRAGSASRLLLLLIFGSGFASAFLMNDTVAIIGTPVVLLLAKNHVISPKPLLLALAFGVTIGSVASPIGNPQNLLIALNGGIENPFITFFRFLFLPTVVNLAIAYFILKLFCRNHFNKILSHSQEPIRDRHLASIAKTSLAVMLLLISAKIAFFLLEINAGFRLSYIALLSALPVLLSPRRVEIIRDIDWRTLIFFASMFVLMESVWETGLFMDMVSGYTAVLSSTAGIISFSIIVSQFISNVPLVALYLPLISNPGCSIPRLMALAAGSTIAGNLSILGAASNIIIIQNAEKKSGETLTFLDFLKVGVPLTVINSLVYYLFLTLT